MIPIQAAYDIRLLNTLEVIRYLLNHKSAYRKDIADAVGLSIASISNICSNLKKDNIIVENEIEVKQINGRSASTLSLSHGKLYNIVLNLTLKDKAELLVLELDGTVLFKFQHDTKNDASQFIQELHFTFKQFCMKYNTNENAFLCMSVIISGIYDKKTHRTDSTNASCFENVDLQNLLESTFSVEVTIENETNIGAFSTKLLLEENHESLIYLYIDEGLGVGLIINNRMYTGKNNFAPEVCCVPLGEESTNIHRCGNNDCAEQHLSILSIQKELVEQFDTYNINDITEKEKLHLYFKRKGILLGRLLSMLLNVLDIELIYIGGRIVEYISHLLPFVESELSSRVVLHTKRNYEFRIDLAFESTIITGAHALGLVKLITLIRRDKS